MFESSGDQAGYLTDFAIDVTLFPGTGNQKTIKGIFDAESIGITLAGGLEVTESQPQLTVLDRDVAELTQGALLKVANRNYTVADLRPDGTGITLIRLNNRS
jgi:hypothetical protein